MREDPVMSGERRRGVARRGNRSRVLRGLATALAGAVSVGVLVWVAKPAKVFDQVSDMNAVWAMVAVALEVGSCLCYVIVFRVLLP